MLSIVDFFLVGHDPLYVGLAAILCMLSAYACMSLLRHAHHASGRLRNIWTAVAALAVGFGIWATHFVAMLAFRPGFQFQYDIWLTGLSLAIAIAVCGAGIAMAVRGTGRADHFLGGAVVGVAISTMHYTGIAALVMGGTIDWNPTQIAGSILAGIILAGLSVVAVMSGGWRLRLVGAALLTLAICAMHFTAMGAADFSRCFPLVADGQLGGGLLSVGVAVISVLILGAAIGSALLDDVDRRRTARELRRQLDDTARITEATQRLELAMAHMAQGLCLFNETGCISLYNTQFSTMLGLPQNVSLDGLSLGELVRLAMDAASGTPVADQMVEDMLEQHLAAIRRGDDVVHSFATGATLRVVHSPIGNGSWVTTVEDITERTRSEQAIAHMARHDALTGLPNRAMFDERFALAFADARDSHSSLAVIAIDLDRFKEVNDSFGHAAGDAVLQTLAARLSDRLKEGELLARLGGDEFAAFKTFTSMDALREFLARLEAGLFGLVDIESLMIHTGGSIGVAIYPQDGMDRSKLMSNADLAMYRAKAELDRHICYYESEMDELARQRRDMGRDIWSALEMNAFYLVYQVQRSVSTGEITGYEVLLRWDRPGHGPVSPSDFIPVAEECGAIGLLGNWVLKMACLDAASWPEPHKIAVNVSGLQLSQIELIETVRNVLFQSGLAPSRLELEVTETSIIADKKRALHILRQIKAMGVSIAIDDFGTGYSSLDTLRSFPFDKIKLDRSFMTEVEVNDQSKAIVRAILALGRSLSVPVLAEGVETSAQLDVLRIEGCNEAQGFLFGRPGAIDWADELEPLRIA